jgi:hypothetical protein
MEKRTGKRFFKETSIRFGEKTPEHIGLTHDVSLTGIFIKSSRIYPPETHLVLEIEKHNGTKFQHKGVVRRAKRVPPGIARVTQKSGMWVSLTEHPEEYREFIHELDGSEAIPHPADKKV